MERGRGGEPSHPLVIGYVFDITEWAIIKEGLAHRVYAVPGGHADNAFARHARCPDKRAGRASRRIFSERVNGMVLRMEIRLPLWQYGH
jgi:hypothetical protein